MRINKASGRFFRSSKVITAVVTLLVIGFSGVVQADVESAARELFQPVIEASNSRCSATFVCDQSLLDCKKRATHLAGRGNFNLYVSRKHDSAPQHLTTLLALGAVAQIRNGGFEIDSVSSLSRTSRLDSSSEARCTRRKSISFISPSFLNFFSDKRLIQNKLSNGAFRRSVIDQFLQMDRERNSVRLHTQSLCSGSTLLQNPKNLADVNGDGHCSPIDALIIIGLIDKGVDPVTIPSSSKLYLDSNGDCRLSSLDTEVVIACIEGSKTNPTVAPSPIATAVATAIPTEIPTKIPTPWNPPIATAINSPAPTIGTIPARPTVQIVPTRSAAVATTSIPKPVNPLPTAVLPPANTVGPLAPKPTVHAVPTIPIKVTTARPIDPPLPIPPSQTFVAAPTVAPQPTAVPTVQTKPTVIPTFPGDVVLTLTSDGKTSGELASADPYISACALDGGASCQGVFSAGQSALIRFPQRRIERSSGASVPFTSATCYGENNGVPQTFTYRSASFSLRVFANVVCTAYYGASGNTFKTLSIDMPSFSGSSIQVFPRGEPAQGILYCQGPCSKNFPASRPVTIIWPETITVNARAGLEYRNYCGYSCETSPPDSEFRNKKGLRAGRGSRGGRGRQGARAVRRGVSRQHDVYMSGNVRCQARYSRGSCN